MAASLLAGRSKRAAPAGVTARFATTPGRLRLESAVIIGLTVLTGLLAGFVVSDQAASTRQITEESAPAIVSARQVQASLAEANAAAAVAFLAGGVEDLSQREIYETSLATASTELERAARLVGDDEQAHLALEEMTAALPRYAGLIESARANNRQGFPVGAAYLSAASALLESEIYPNADLVANQAAARYREAYDHQRGLKLVLGVVVAGCAALVALALIFGQIQLRRRFNRVINTPMLAATVLAIGLTGWLVTGLANQRTHLTDARTDGYVGTRLYLDLRSSSFGAKADEAQFLIARGAGANFEVSFGHRADQIADLEADLSAHAATSDSENAVEQIDLAYIAWNRYGELHEQIVAADESGEREAATATALGDSVSAFVELDTATSGALAANQEVFQREMAEAGQALRGMQYGSLLVCALIAALAAFGLQLRINEYR